MGTRLWKVTYGSAPGPGGRGRREGGWDVTDGTRSFRSTNHADALWLCLALNTAKQQGANINAFVEQMECIPHVVDECVCVRCKNIRNAIAAWEQRGK
jgi:hypothetical protein